MKHKKKDGCIARLCECGKTTIYTQDPMYEKPRAVGSECDRCRTVVTNAKQHGWGICPLEPRSVLSSTINESIARSRFYKKTIAKNGVKGADLIQPYRQEGQKYVPNEDFVERYGTKEYTPEQKDYIKAKLG